MPNKTPTCYSIVVLNVPPQWDVYQLENDFKMQHSTVVKVERLFINGGKPISKVRVDFSDSREVTGILKQKKILLDENSTAYPVELYIPPMRVLRCYNCQKYNDHIAANCPDLDNPVCFKCGQSHPFSPKCTNQICCAHCQGPHMSGSPQCPVKAAERKKCNDETKKKNNNNTNVRAQQQFGTNPWTNHSNNVLYGQSQATTTNSFIEKLHDAMPTIIVQQKELDAKKENKFSTLAQEFDEYFMPHCTPDSMMSLQR
ncbi:unnamed protein product [Didymodactylos carnosus]|uniref:CCHC-type domain-containing protein n=1 Tax=Didymodactylos carnosus TaxID=1234261 RepID=A0A814H6L5_9BILA|nr:unnamed protein product [Didymodactylos carnosus]CAF1376172.1 unnamed protein product [Didymodactylos carnosus]CAF3777316.1 unnamed protein product [Didymodactylos carnosus]CAF4184925.1 unnamed protein product [Didymodactylos carnosus]